MYLQRCLIVTRLVPRETAAVSAHSVHVIPESSNERDFRDNHHCLQPPPHFLIHMDTGDNQYGTSVFR